MKLLFFCLVTSFSVSVLAECDKKIDPSKIIFFVDTNNSEPEIDTAQKSACERGERLVVIPNNHREFSAIIQENTRLQEAVQGCLENCEPLIQQYKDSKKKYNAFRKSQKPFSTEISEALTAIKNQKGKIQSFIISGHNGGGSFSGNKGRFSRLELLNLMQNFPEVNDVKSAMLLGCYTGVQNEIAEWKFIFPHAKLIAGYDVKAPLADVPAGHQYITEILGKEKELIAQAEQNALNDFAKNQIPSMFAFDMFTAVYLNCGPENKDFYYASTKGEQLFTPLDKNSCALKQGEINQILMEIGPYLMGELEPPLDTNGPIREIYNKARALEHCKDQFPQGFTVNSIFNLLFYENFKKNYAKFYEKDLAEVERILATINVTDVVNGATKIINDIKQDIAKLERDKELLDSGDYQKVKEKEVNELRVQMDQFLQDHPFLLSGVPVDQLTSKQRAIFDKYYPVWLKLHRAISGLTLANGNNEPAILNDLNSTIDNYKHNITVLEATKIVLKNEPETLKTLWSPTQKNLEQKSRQELMNNIHSINLVMSTQGASAEQQAALSFVANNATNHLVYFQNPFSWYEYNPDHIETPPTVLKLEYFKKTAPVYTFGTH